MKADLFVQGHFWATIDLPGDSLLTLLAKGMITEAQQRADQLKADLDAIDGVKCSIHLRLQDGPIYPPGEPNRSHPTPQKRGGLPWASPPSKETIGHDSP